MQDLNSPADTSVSVNGLIIPILQGETIDPNLVHLADLLYDPAMDRILRLNIPNLHQITILGDYDYVGKLEMIIDVRRDTIVLRYPRLRCMGKEHFDWTREVFCLADPQLLDKVMARLPEGYDP